MRVSGHHRDRWVNTLALICIVSLCLLIWGTAHALEAGDADSPESSSEVEVRLLREMVFDSEIQLMRVKDGYPRLVVTEETINWLDREGNVAAHAGNPYKTSEETHDEISSGAEIIQKSLVFASNNGEWVGIRRTDFSTRSWLSLKSKFSMLDAMGHCVAEFPIESCTGMSISDNGERIAVYGPRASLDEWGRLCRFILYDRAGHALAQHPEKDVSKWVGQVRVAFGPESRRIVVAPASVQEWSGDYGESKTTGKGHASVLLLDEDGRTVWTKDLEGHGHFVEPREGVPFSSDGDRLLVARNFVGESESGTLSHFNISGEMLGECRLPHPALHEILPDSAMSRVLVRYRNTIHCIDMIQSLEVWRWTVPWSISPSDRSPTMLWSGKHAVFLGKSGAGVAHVCVFDADGREVAAKDFESENRSASFPPIDLGSTPEAVFAFTERNRVLVCSILGGTQ